MHQLDEEYGLCEDDLRTISDVLIEVAAEYGSDGAGLACG